MRRQQLSRDEFEIETETDSSSSPLSASPIKESTMERTGTTHERTRDTRNDRRDALWMDGNNYPSTINYCSKRILNLEIPFSSPDCRSFVFVELFPTSFKTLQFHEVFEVEFSDLKKKTSSIFKTGF